MRASFAVVAALVICVAASGSASANPADLDPTFGSGGTLAVPFPGVGSGAAAVALQIDGKIVGAGYAGADVALVRSHPDGTLDGSFGVGGVVTTDFGGSEGATGVALLPDGRIVVAGSSSGPGLVIARYQSDGTLDPTFGVGGRVSSPSHSGQSMILQTDGMVVVGGFGAHAFMLARYDGTGVLDPDFGNAGVAFADFPDSGGHPIQLLGLALQPDGKVVAVGGAGDVIALARFETDGTLDATFGTSGTTTTDVHIAGAPPGNASSAGWAVLVQADGKLAVAGYTRATGDSGDGFPIQFGRALALRYDADGALDTTFNATGIVIVSGGGIFSGAPQARALVQQADDKLVVIGSSGYLRKRLNTDGTIDGSFASSQTVAGGASGLALQPDAKLVAAGTANSGSVFALVRFGAGDCGDDVVDPGEACDDGNGVNGDGCDNNCTVTACGNHILTTGEDCEPSLSYCCTSACTFESLGTPCIGYGSACSVFECNGAGTCTAYGHPQAACVAAPSKRSKIGLGKLADYYDRTLSWSWGKGPATLADLPDPFDYNTWRLCIYDYAVGTPNLVISLPLLNSCGACRKTTSKGWDYNQKAGFEGYLRWSLRAVNGKGNFKFKAKGSFLGSNSSLPLTADPKIVVQLRNELGGCWGGDFTMPTKNSADQYKAKSD